MLKKKYVFIGDTNSINLEIIFKSFNYLKNKCNYILIGSINEIFDYKIKINSKIEIESILDPYNFNDLSSNKLNVYDVNSGKNKLERLINQISLSNKFANETNIDLVTMPINKAVLKRNNDFNGLTEYLGKINKSKTFMVMVGDVFSIIPITTHIPIKSLKKNLTKEKINNFFINFKMTSKTNLFFKNFKNFIFLCLNPHCGEDGIYSRDDIDINKLIENNNIDYISQMPSDSAFKKIKKNSLYISCYHDQALIPFKIINKRALNFTVGLKFRRISPAHGTAIDIKFKNQADNSSYLACMEF